MSPGTSESHGTRVGVPSIRTSTSTSLVCSSRWSDRSVCTRWAAPTSAFAPSTVPTSAASVTEPTAADRAAPSPSNGVSGFANSSNSDATQSDRFRLDPGDRCCVAAGQAVVSIQPPGVGAESFERFAGIDLVPPLSGRRTRWLPSAGLLAGHCAEAQRRKRAGVDREQRTLGSGSARAEGRPDAARRCAGERDQCATSAHLLRHSITAMICQAFSRPGPMTRWALHGIRRPGRTMPRPTSALRNAVRLRRPDHHHDPARTAGARGPR